jgi:hypothetical protein
MKVPCGPAAGRGLLQSSGSAPRSPDQAILPGSSRMHVFTHLKSASEGKTAFGIYEHGMVEHDGHVGH